MEDLSSFFSQLNSLIFVYQMAKFSTPYKSQLNPNFFINLQQYQYLNFILRGKKKIKQYTFIDLLIIYCKINLFKEGLQKMTSFSRQRSALSTLHTSSGLSLSE